MPRPPCLFRFPAPRRWQTIGPDGAVQITPRQLHLFKSRRRLEADLSDIEWKLTRLLRLGEEGHADAAVAGPPMNELSRQEWGAFARAGGAAGRRAGGNHPRWRRELSRLGCRTAVRIALLQLLG